jgi:multisite-specific tRNA:(cytosine-C5)-methyltransferase
MCRKRAAEDEAKDEPEGKRAKLDEPDASIDDEPLEADEEAIAAPAEAPAPAARPAKDKAAAAGDTSYKEAPFTFLAPSDPNVAACAAQLALLPAFPHAHLYARAEPGEPVRALYLATPLLHALLAGTPARRMRLLSAGARVFVRQGQGAASRFRVLAEGLPVVRTWVAPAAVLDADLRALRALLEAYYPLCAVFAQPFRAAIERCSACPTPCMTSRRQR